VTAVYLWCYQHVPDWLREATWLAFMLAVIFAIIYLLEWATGWSTESYPTLWG
jgi:hypothetical protein